MCPCGSGAAYEACCGRYHAGPQHLLAATPEALMRSRYSAYVLGLREYVLDTWHASTRPEHLERFDSGLKWLGLTVKRVWTTGPDEGFVDFVARNKPPGGKWMLLSTDLNRLLTGVTVDVATGVSTLGNVNQSLMNRLPWVVICSDQGFHRHEFDFIMGIELVSGF